MFILPDLPYAYDALEPAISETTMRTHHDKHHAKYVSTLNALLEDAGGGASTLEEVIRHARAGGKTKVANNAGQAWNHGFFWESMAPAKTRPGAGLSAAIDQAFGGFDAFQAAFVKDGAAHFGSGWVWLVAKGSVLEVTTTHDGEVVLPDAETVPILLCDLWEHAYYLDYKNDREAFLKAWIGGLANWTFADAQFEAAKGGGEGYRFPQPREKAA